MARIGHPGRFLAGKTLDGGAQSVNLVHLDDVVAACMLLLERGKDGDVFNLSAPVHPRREQFYSFAARQQGLPAPVFIEPAGEFQAHRRSADLPADGIQLSLARSGPLVCRARRLGQLRFAKGVIAPYHAAIHEREAVMMVDTKRHPDGELLLRTLAMPADTNPNGDIFGGWIMSQMDIGGGIMAKELAKGRICTVSVEGMNLSQSGQGGRCGLLLRPLHEDRAAAP